MELILSARRTRRRTGSASMRLLLAAKSRLRFALVVALSALGFVVLVRHAGNATLAGPDPVISTGVLAASALELEEGARWKAPGP